MLQAGRYKARIIGQRLGESSKKNTPYLRLTFQVFAKVHAGAEMPINPPQTGVCDFYITEKTVDRVVEDLESLGFGGDSFSQLDEGHSDPWLFTNQEIMVECKLEPYEGKMQERFQYINPNRQFFTELDQTQQRQLDQLYGDRFKSGGKQQQTRKPQQQAAVAQASSFEEDDDIPF